MVPKQSFLEGSAKTFNSVLEVDSGTPGVKNHWKTSLKSLESKYKSLESACGQPDIIGVAEFLRNRGKFLD